MALWEIGMTLLLLVAYYSNAKLIYVRCIISLHYIVYLANFLDLLSNHIYWT